MRYRIDIFSPLLNISPSDHTVNLVFLGPLLDIAPLTHIKKLLKLFNFLKEFTEIGSSLFIFYIYFFTDGRAFNEEGIARGCVHGKIGSMASIH
jgi:hypothetical protein